MATPSKTKSAAVAQRQRQRKIQREQDARDHAASAGRQPKAPKPAVQAGHRHQPENPLPRQRLAKPGLEADMELRPRFLAPDYHGSGKLEGMTALITGGDSGIGRAVAVLFAREGADVAVVYLDEHEDARETQQHVEAEGQRCLLISGDVSDERLGMTLETNISGYFRMARAAIPHLGQGASIINTGSVTGLEGSGHLLDYSTTKGAIHAFTKALASNLLDKGIRVNAVAPGPVWTPLNPADQEASRIAHFGEKTDMKRPAQPEELSPAYVFLAAPCCSSYITGIVLPVTGSIGAI